VFLINKYSVDTNSYRDLFKSIETSNFSKNSIDLNKPEKSRFSLDSKPNNSDINNKNNFFIQKENHKSKKESNAKANETISPEERLDE